MANQDPQPELYTTRHSFTTANTTGDLTSNAVSTGQIDLAWTDNTTGENGFKIERSLDGIQVLDLPNSWRLPPLCWSI